MKYFILMADMISSSEKAAKPTMEQFKSAVEECNVRFKKFLLSPLTITLGDEFQGITDTLATATQLIIYLEETLIDDNAEFRLRYVLNYGNIDTPVNPEIAYGMLGDGLTHARKALTELKKEKDKRFKFMNISENTDEVLNDSFLIYQSLVHHWKAEDQEIVSEFLEGKDYKEVAANLVRDVSLMWRRRRSLKINEYLACKRVINYLSA